jgi:hypothetical protein
MKPPTRTERQQLDKLLAAIENYAVCILQEALWPDRTQVDPADTVTARKRLLDVIEELDQ